MKSRLNLHCPCSGRACYRLGPAILAAVLFGVAYWLTPPFFDDWIFEAEYRRINDGSTRFSLSAWIEFVRQIREYDNSRLSNILILPASLWSPWKELYPWLTGCLTAAIFYVCARFGFGRRMSRPEYTFVWIVFAFCLPWHRLLLIRDYSINYIWSTAVTLAAIPLVMRTPRRGPGLAAAFVLVVLSGLWHEGIALPTICGLCLAALFRRFRMPARWWALMAVYIASVLVMMLSPGILGRFARETAEPNNYLSRIFLGYSATTFFLFLSVIGFLFTAAGRRRLAVLTSRKGSPFFPVFTGAAFAALAQTLFVTVSPRVLFYPNICAVTALAILWRPVWYAVPLRLREVAGMAFLLFGVVQLCLSIAVQVRVRDEWREVTAGVAASPRGTYFKDVLQPSDTSPLTLRLPTVGPWDEPFNIVCLGAISGRDVAVVPAALRDAVPSGPDTVPSNLLAPLYAAPGGRAFFTTPAALPGHKVPPAGEMVISSTPRADLHLDGGTIRRSVFVPFFYYSNERGDTLIRIYIPNIGGSRIEYFELLNDSIK